MVACVHVALALRLKSKIWEHLYWYLQVYSMIFVPLSFGCLQKNTRLYHGRRRVWRPRRLAYFLLDFISTNNIAIGLVRVCTIRFQPTKIRFHPFKKRNVF
jgi:hypothetical protein